MANLPLITSSLIAGALKHVPIVGPAIEVVDGVRQRFQVFSLEEKLADVESQLTSLEFRLREVVQSELEEILTNLRNTELGPDALARQIRNLRGIRQNGWEPVLFDGLFKHSRHFKSLRANPHNFGQVLEDAERPDPQRLHVLVETDRTRLLELTPAAFGHLLFNQTQAPDGAIVSGSQDVWAFARRSKQLDQLRRPPGSGRLGSPPSSIGEVRRGVVKKLTEKGFGFLDSDQGDVFFHRSDVQGGAFDDLQEGQQLSYEVEQREQGLRARYVKVQ